MPRRVIGRGSGPSGSRDRASSSGSHDQGSGNGSRDQGSGNGSRDQGSGNCWGTLGSQDVQPDTTDRLRETPQFEADDPETSTMTEEICYRMYTEEVENIPLPTAAAHTRECAERHHSRALQQYRQLTNAIKTRVRNAKEHIARNKGTATYSKPGRMGNKVITKRPPLGRRVVLQWSDNPCVPIGEWATRFNNLAGCLVKRADFINPYFGFHQQPFNSINDIWQELMKSYCLEDHPFAWEYLFGPNGKVPSLIRSWRCDLKREFYDKIQEDWERLWKLDPRVDTHHFVALLFYWDDPKNKEKSLKAKANRESKEYDHFLGTRSFAQVEYEYLKTTSQSVMPLNLLIRKGYTPKEGYDKPLKLEKIRKMQEQVDAAMSQTLQESQTDGEGGQLDVHNLSREQNDKIIESVFGPSKKGMRRFRGSGVWTSSNTTTSSGSTMPSSMQHPSESQSVTQLTEHVTHILITKLSPVVFATAMPLMIGSFTPSDTLTNAKRSIVMSLAGKIPDDIYFDIVKDIMGPSTASNQRRDTIGSTSAIPARNIDDDVEGDGDHEEGDENDGGEN